MNFRSVPVSASAAARNDGSIVTQHSPAPKPCPCRRSRKEWLLRAACCASTPSTELENRRAQRGENIDCLQRVASKAFEFSRAGKDVACCSPIAESAKSLV